MSLARTALRLAVVQALTADVVIAGLCGPRIYDSRIGELDSAEPVPVLVILTEDASGSAYSENNGGPPFEQRCDLVFEMSLRLLATVDGQAGIMLVETDREAEALLDLIEDRAIETVTVGATPQARLIREVVTRKATEFKSVRFSSDETGVKLAVRVVHLTMQLTGDDPEIAGAGSFALLPEPLRSVAESLPIGSSARDTCLRLVSALAGTAPADTPFLAAGITVAPRLDIDPATPPVPAPGQVDPEHASFRVTAGLTGI